MILLNINERKWYVHKEGFAEDVINDMFKEYFKELYQEDAMIWRISEMWEKISIKIPKQAVFVEKDAVLYSLNSDLKFEVAPEDFFEIDEVSHPVLIECFKECYSEFKNLIKNYRAWNDEQSDSIRQTDSIANIYLQTSTKYVPDIESLSETLNSAEHTFDRILNVSLKPKISNHVKHRIVKVYESSLLQSDSIMLITKTDSCTQKKYAVTENLEVEEVTYSIIERELEEIIHEVVPKDTDFLVNRIYNFMMLPLSNVEPCIRINKVQDIGLNATIFFEEKGIPVVCDFSLKHFYAFLRIEHDYRYFPTKAEIRYYDNRKICVESISPEIGVKEFQKINRTMFENMSCYFEYCGKEYITYHYTSEYGYQRKEKNTQHNILYKMHKGKLEKIFKEEEVKEDTSEHENFKKIIEQEGRKAKEQGSYAFWEITFEEITENITKF